MIFFRLGQIMENRNLTIQFVHEKTGISRNTISQMINKHPKGIQFDTLDKLITNLDVTLEDLIHYYPDRFSKKYEFADLTTDYKTELNYNEINGVKYLREIERDYFLLLRLKNDRAEDNSEIDIKFNVNVYGYIEYDEVTDKKTLQPIQLSMEYDNMFFNIENIIGIDDFESVLVFDLFNFLISDIDKSFSNEIDHIEYNSLDQTEINIL